MSHMSHLERSCRDSVSFTRTSRPSLINLKLIKIRWQQRGFESEPESERPGSLRGESNVCLRTSRRPLQEISLPGTSHNSRVTFDVSSCLMVNHFCIVGDGSYLPITCREAREPTECKHAKQAAQLELYFPPKCAHAVAQPVKHLQIEILMLPVDPALCSSWLGELPVTCVPRKNPALDESNYYMSQAKIQQERLSSHALSGTLTCQYLVGVRTS